MAGGYGSGKTTAAIIKCLLLSAIYPGNEGIIGRFRGSDLEDSTKKVFFDVCPVSWIPARGGYNKQSNTVTLINGSKIYFRHIHDPNARGGMKTRRVGANLGWFYIDQMEEIDRTHWDTMVSRLRNPKAKKKFGFGTLNPNGRDWNQKTFFPDASELKPEELFRVQRHGNILGVSVNSEENRISNGGFLDDDYFDRMLENWPPEQIARYIHCSFDDFAGKIYREYNMESVHNIRPFPIPDIWPLTVGIDVGGDSPWAVVPNYFDEYGNAVVTDGYDKAGVNVAEVARWIKDNLPWDNSRTTFIIDPENKVAMIELAEHGIMCRPARKSVLPSILRSGNYFHVNPKLSLPPWYLEHQPAEYVKKFHGKGSPRTFVFETNLTYREEHDTYQWSPTRRNEPHKTHDKRWDSCDADRYVKFSRPEVAKLPVIEDKYREIRMKRGDSGIDNLSAREFSSLDKRMAARAAVKAGALVREATADETAEFGDSNYTPQFESEMDW